MSLSAIPDNTDKTRECKLTCDFEILKKSPIFKDADSDVVRLFAYLASRKKYKPGELIISLDEEADFAFYLIAGKAEVLGQYKKKEVVLQIITPGMLCGELALLASIKWFFSVRATEECEIISISRKSFQKVLQAFPEKRDRLIEKIVQLRIGRFIEQTNFMLDNLPESLLNQPVWSPSSTSV